MSEFADVRLLLVDDEAAILELLQIVLNKEGFEQVFTSVTGEQAVENCRTHPPHLIVLDVMLPDMEGFEACRQLRQLTQAPILFLTARSSDLDKLMGFGMGADDYITKPFNPLEVVARIKAQVRRQFLQPVDQQPAEQQYHFGRFQVLEHAGELIVNGQNVVCPAREFQLLLFFCKHPNRVFSRDQLYEQVWGEESFGDDHTVMVHIRRLREKIEQDPGQPRYLVTVRGLGYKLIPSSHAGDHS